MLLTGGRLLFTIQMKSFTNLPQREHDLFNKNNVPHENQL